MGNFTWLAPLVLWSATMDLKPGDQTRTLEVDARPRSYTVHVPPKYAREQPIPVVLVFHGGGSNVEQMIDYCGMNELADRESFLVVYPAGTGRVEGILTFNGGNCCGYAQRQNVDDVKFVAALLDDLATVARLDERRIYATGMSNGAILSYRLADELSHRFAAIAPVAGPMGAETCAPRQPVSVIHFHGADDRFAPFAGGRGARSLSQTDFFSVDHSIGQWIRANGCPATPHTKELLANQVDDDMHATRTIYGPGKDGAEVVLITIHGGGHTWPGRTSKFKFLGPSTLDISANELMWEFFQRHPKPAAR
ncbi:MAG: hypothetical protein KDA42_07195 [Planctomycetales bacterium]|nr:hypothetical protein [Planctomycetales bacterium]